MENKPESLRSAAITAGVERSPNRAMLRAVGFGDGDFTKPIVGIANAYSNLTPCNVSVPRLLTRKLIITIPSICGSAHAYASC